jgi:hypothetical protein
MMRAIFVACLLARVCWVACIERVQASENEFMHSCKSGAAKSDFVEVLTRDTINCVFSLLCWVVVGKFVALLLLHWLEALQLGDPSSP